MFARGAGAGTEAQAGGTLLRVDVELDAWAAGAGGVTEDRLALSQLMPVVFYLLHHYRYILLPA
jgi:hypothetical protein